jgi:hypothetical protein
MKMHLTGILLALCIFSFEPAHAVVPKLMTYQGVLKNSSGSFLTGTYSMTFRIYSASTGGTALWTETQPSVSASSGKFSVTLGSVTALNLTFNADYWLSIQVGTDAEMSPRVRLTSMAYGIRSDYENYAFTQAQHDALSHENIAGVKDNALIIAKTNFKLDAYTLAAANSMGDLVVDSFNDATGIHAAFSFNYAWRASPDLDVTITPTGGGSVKENTNAPSNKSMLSNATDSYNGHAQSFRPTSQVIVDKATFKWCRDGNPSGNVRIRLYSVSAGIPGALLAESSNIPVSSIATYPNYTDVTASFTPVTLQANTDYIVALENIDGSGNSTNYVSVAKADSDVFSPGQAFYKNSSGTWAAQGTGGDDYFKVYQQVTYSGTGTVISKAYPEPAVPTEAMVIADETLGTGSITYYVSRNDGINWTQCTKETVTSISAQPSGTQLKWKAVITGNAQLNAIAVAV